MLKKIVFILAVLCYTSPLAQAATVSLSWNKNAESDLAGYRLYYGNVSRTQSAYAQSVTISNREAATWQLSLQPGVYYFALTAVDTSGNESGYSQEVTETIPESIQPPGKPGKPQLMP
jgi:hypothetical protein